MGLPCLPAAALVPDPARARRPGSPRPRHHERRARAHRRPDEAVAGHALSQPRRSWWTKGWSSRSTRRRGPRRGGGRPRFYRITPLGRRACAAEAERLAGFVAGGAPQEAAEGLNPMPRRPSARVDRGAGPALSARLPRRGTPPSSRARCTRASSASAPPAPSRSSPACVSPLDAVVSRRFSRDVARPRPSRLAPRASTSHRARRFPHAVPPLRRPSRAPACSRRAPLFSALVVGHARARDRREHRDLQRRQRACCCGRCRTPHPERLVVLYEGIASRPEPFGFSAPDLVAFRERARSYDGARGVPHAPSSSCPASTSRSAITAARISASLLDVLGVAPALGPRVHRRGRHRPAAGRDPVGRAVAPRRSAPIRRSSAGRSSLDRRAYTIVGVMPARVHVPQSRPAPQQRARRTSTCRSRSAPVELARVRQHVQQLGASARLKPGVTPQQARAEAAAIAKQIVAEVYPAQLRDIGFALTATVDADARRSRRRRQPHARRAAGGRRRAAADRLRRHRLPDADARGGARARDGDPDGARRRPRARDASDARRDRRCSRSPAAAVGLALAWWRTARAARPSAPTSLPRAQEIALDGRVLAFTRRVVAAATLVCGLLPAFEVVAARLARRAEGRRRAARAAGVAAAPDLRRPRHRCSSRAPSCCSPPAVLLIRSFVRLMAIDPGFQSDHVDLGGDQPAGEQLSDRRRASARFYGRLLERVARAARRHGRRRRHRSAADRARAPRVHDRESARRRRRRCRARSPTTG